VASFDPVANKNELDLTFHVEKQNITLYFDPEKLEKVIFNLLSNAVKFTPAGGKLTIMAKKNPTKEANFPSGWLEISVCDTGPGIPREQLAHIFDRFFQPSTAVKVRTAERNLLSGFQWGIPISSRKKLSTIWKNRISVRASRKSRRFI
jgi:signal transduction histidine kinase